MVVAKRQRAYRQRLKDAVAKRRAPQASTSPAPNICMDVDNTANLKNVEKYPMDVVEVGPTQRTWLLRVGVNGCFLSGSSGM